MLRTFGKHRAKRPASHRGDGLGVCAAERFALDFWCIQGLLPNPCLENIDSDALRRSLHTVRQPRRSPLALGTAERQRVLDVLLTPECVDSAPHTV